MSKESSDQALPAAETGRYLKSGTAKLPTFVFAHGAGAGMESDFMTQVAEGMANQGVQVIRFEFPYMQIRRALGTKRPPDRAPKLLEHFKAELKAIGGPFVIGGKSMGGRMASMLVAQLNEDQDPLLDEIKGVVAFGYPFHPQGKPENLRTDHFENVSVPMLVLQGSRDKLGDRELVSGLALPANMDVQWFEDGDHDLKPRKASGYTHEDHINQAITSAADFVKGRLS